MSTAGEEVYQTLRGMLEDRQMVPGQRISQRKIARELGYSIVPVVEAVHRLASEGLLTNESRKMPLVRELSEDDVEALYLMREAFESAGARLCTQRIRDDEIEKLKALGKKFEDAIDPDVPFSADKAEVEIHRFIVQCARCSLLEEEIRRLLLIERTATWFKHWPEPEQYRKSHRAIIEAIAGRDPDSAELFMRKHIRAGFAEYSSEEGKDK